jgi:preprotein translocase subunit SecA
VLNLLRVVIYSLRWFALEGGEELKGEALKMIEKAISKRVETAFAEVENAADWDFALLRQDLLMHYLLTVPEFEGSDLPTTIPDATTAGVEAGRKAFATKLQTLAEYADQLLALVMLNVLDEKWKDHLYDLDQLRGAIHYRSWGQKDPLIEYKQEAYTMFVDLMSDIFNTFTERFLRVQIVFDQQQLGAPAGGGFASGNGRRDGDGARGSRPTKRYNALGILEDIPAEELEPVAEAEAETEVQAESESEAPEDAVLDIAPDEPPKQKPVAKADPMIIGAGRARSLSSATQKPTGPVDWSSVGRNDPCPCGSGKKFKKCHGINA